MKKQLLLLITTLLSLSSFSQVTEITGNYNAQYTGAFVFNNKMMIVSKNDNNNYELWEVNDQNEAEFYIALPDTSDYAYIPMLFTTLNNKIYYRGYSDSTVNLMEIDGTTITNITNYPKNQSTIAYGLSNCDDIVAFENNIYFIVINSLGNREFLYYDGSQLNTIGTGDYYSDLQIFKNKLFLNYYEPTTYGSDMAYLNNNVIQVISGDYTPSTFDNYTIYNDNLYFAATDTTYGFELWKTDGTTANFVYDLRPGTVTSGTGSQIPNNSVPYPTVVFKEKLYLNVQNADINGYLGGGTFMYDDSDNSVEKDEMLHLGIDSGFRVNRSIVFNDKLYYEIDDTIHGYELYVYDGTNQPSLLMDINTTNNTTSYPYNSAYTQDYIEYNNKLYFTAENGVSRKMFVVDEEIVESISELQSLEVSLSPNPTKDKIKFETKERISSIEIYDLRGQKVATFEDTNTINFSRFSKGIYFAKVSNVKNETSIKKIIKE